MTPLSLARTPPVALALLLVLLGPVSAEGMGTECVQARYAPDSGGTGPVVKEVRGAYEVGVQSDAGGQPATVVVVLDSSQCGANVNELLRVIGAFQVGDGLVETRGMPIDAALLP